MKKVLFFAIIILISGSFVWLNISIVRAVTLNVCPQAGAGCDYTDIQTAVNAATSGDTISIAAGTYALTGSINITTANLTLTGPAWLGTTSAPTAILDGTNAAPISCAFAVNASNTTIRNLKVQNFPDNGIGTGAGITDLTFENNYFHNNVNGIAITQPTTGTGNIIIQNNIITNSRFSDGGSGSGIHLSTVEEDVTIQHNTIYNNGFIGIRVTDGNNTPTIKNNIIANSDNKGMEFTLANTYSSFNAIYNNTGGNTGGTGDLSIDCYLNDPDNGDFSLKALSRCINEGENGTYIGVIAPSASRTTTINVPTDIADIDDAVAYAATGDTVSIAAGTYIPSATLTVSQNNVTLQGASAATSIIDFNNAAYRIVLSGTGNILQNLSFINSTNGASTVLLGPGSTVQDCYVHNNTNNTSGARAAVAFNLNATGVTVQRNIIYNNTARGIQLSTGSSGTIQNNVVYNNTGTNTAGVNSQSTTGALTVRNNIIMNNTAGLTSSVSGVMTNTYNIVYGNTTNYSGISQGTGELITIDPAFVQTDTPTTPATFFALKSFSEAIAGGHDGTTDIGAVDFTGTPAYTITVAASGADYASVSNALNAISGNVARTISVAAGSYTSQAITLKSNVTLTGAGASTTTLTGDGSNPVMTATNVSNATISGFTITGGTHGISISGGDGITLQGNTVTNNSTVASYGGVSLSNVGTAGSPVTLSNNTITSNGNGLIASGTSVVVSNNDSITNNTSSNILATGLTGSGQLTINKTLTVTVTSDLDASGVEGATISYVDGQSGTGSFASTTNSSGQSSKSLASIVYATSGASTDYSSYTVTATGASSRTSSSAATIDTANETLGLTLDYTPPASTSISINSGATDTSDTAVTLTLAATSATQMMISNASDFTGANWETYATSKSWTLSEDDGTKTVYAKFRDTYTNASTAINDTINLSGGRWGNNPPQVALPIVTPVPIPVVVTPPAPAPAQPPPTPTTTVRPETEVSRPLAVSVPTPTVGASPVVEQVPPSSVKIQENKAKLIKSQETSTVYLVDLETNTKQPIFNERIFTERGFSWQQVETVKAQELTQYTPAKPVLYSNNSVIKFTDNKVYEIRNDYELQWIPTEQEFEKTHVWNEIKVLPDSLMASFRVR